MDIRIAIYLACVVSAVFKTWYHFTNDKHLLSEDSEWYE